MVEIKSDDNLLIKNLLDNVSKISKEEAKKIANEFKSAEKRISNLEFSYPVDQNIINSLEKLLPLIKNSNSLYYQITELKELWFKLIDRSIKCLRFFDTREPYLDIPGKQPQSYGLEELKSYYEEFAEFETLLYGSNQFYRDHVIHLFRTWLIGMNILINKPKTRALYKIFQIEGISADEFTFNFFECISVWTISSLCHDLGYPLEKFQGIINRTQKMMEYLVSQPKIQQDISFSGSQDKLNEYIIKLISSKMLHVKNSSKKNPLYHARTQSKYYMKYSKSLADYSHGIISAIIIYKVLLYFLESDFSFHDDYTFRHEDAKQFYLRRDILRSIASHTCRDIYHMHSNTFPLLIIIADDLQEWGRKRWIDFYRNKQKPKTKFTLANYDNKNITIEYVFEKIKTSEVYFLIESFYNNFQKFRKLFRDGQDTADRGFSLYIRYNLKLKTKKEINVTLLIPDKDPASFLVSGEEYSHRKYFLRALGPIKNLGEISVLKECQIKISKEY